MGKLRVAIVAAGVAITLVGAASAQATIRTGSGLVAIAGPARAAPLAWSTPRLVDHHPPFDAAPFL
jgi:hypothetical protein